MARIGSPRRAHRRSDLGRSRLPAELESQLASLLDTQERPNISAVLRRLGAHCAARGLRAPARGTVYNAMERVAVRQLAWHTLPAEVQRALYNLASEDGGDAPRFVGGDQIAFYAFNYGSPRAMSFAAGLPWLCLVRAVGRKGWRPKSRALLRAVMKYRGL